jgi:hypothetical protein
MSRLDRRAAAVLFASFTASACVAPSMSTPSSSPSPLHTSPRLVTHDGLESYGDMPLDDALRRIRPELFRYRSSPALIYIDRRPASGAELHGLRADMVASVRLLSPVEAALEYGALYGTGAILDVRLRRFR